MSRARWHLFCALAAAGVLCPPGYGQAVISTHAGVVNFVEGAVTMGGQPLQERLGIFATIPDGGELRTAKGRAEVLLTPGVFLRVGENSAIRLAANTLADTRVELLAGSAMVDSGDPAAGTSVTLLYKNWSVRQAEKGSYRVDSEPARVVACAGSVEVAAQGGGPVKVEQGMEVPLAEVLVPEQTPGAAHDALAQWDQGREESVAADDTIAAGIQDPAKVGDADAAEWAALPTDGFTQYPMLGLPASTDPMLGGYGYTSSPLTPVEPVMGFYSFYLPGYTYRPMLLGLPGMGLMGTGIGRLPVLPGTYLPTLPVRIGGTYGGTHYPIGGTYGGTYGGTRYPIGGVGRPVTVRPVAPRPMPRVGGMHIGGRR